MGFRGFNLLKNQELGESIERERSTTGERKRLREIKERG